MTKFASTLLSVVVLSMIFVCLAGAQATRTWVSGVGDDANPCSRTAPCKTFAGSISKTATGGEINCLDPGGFGSVTITKSITIDCGLNGNTGGSILAAGTVGINVAVSTGTTVAIRNLTINGFSGGTSPGTNGITVSAVASLHLENVKVFGFATSCLNVATSASTQVTVVNSTFSECGSNGINISSSAGTALASFDNIRVWNPGATANGIQVGSNTTLAVRGSDVSFANVGINMTGSAGSTTLVEGSILSNNGTAVIGSSGPIVASKNLFVGNFLVFGAGRVRSTGDNFNVQNTVTGAPVIVPTI